MDDPPVAVVGNGNIAGSNLTNVGNQTVKYNNYLPERTFHPPDLLKIVVLIIRRPNLHSRVTYLP